MDSLVNYGERQESLLPLDAIYYINLDHRVDKRQHMETNVFPYFQQDKLNLADRIERFPAILHPNGAIGCSLSHIAVARKAKSAGARYYIVLEDDFEFLVSREVFQDTLCKILTPPVLDFKVIMLAYNANNSSSSPISISTSSTTSTTSILEATTNAQTTAGFIVNCTYIDELIACWDRGIERFIATGEHWNYACDQCWKELQKEKWFITKPRIGKQRAGFSDIGNGRWVDPAF
jgi:GR25 family glycosyltransferase involved in LPS biosynthesis